MDPMEWRLPGVTRCAGNNCNSGPETWPLHYARHEGVFTRLCSSCVLLSYRSMYCCGCFFLLGPAAPSHNDDLLVAPHEATVTCLVCHEAVAHLSCIDYSTVGVFVCPICRAAAARRPFSYAPSCSEPLDMRGARVILLSTRIALTLLENEAARAQAIGERMVVESAEERKEAYHALSLAFGVDTNMPSTNKHIPPAKNLGKEPQIDTAKLNLGKEPQIGTAKLNLGKEPQIDMVRLDLNEPHIDIAKLDLNEPAPAPPPSPATLEVCVESVQGGMTMASNEPPPPSVVKFTFGMDGLRRETAVASSSEPPPPSMSRFIFGLHDARRKSTMASTQPPLPSLATLTSGTEHVRRELASSSTEPPLPSVAALTLGMEGVCREFATSSKVSPPRPQTLQLFSKDNDEEDKEE